MSYIHLPAEASNRTLQAISIFSNLLKGYFTLNIANWQVHIKLNIPSLSWKQLTKKPLAQKLIAWADFKFALKTLSSVQAFIDMLPSRPHFSQAIGSVGRWQSVLAAEIAFVTLLSMCPVSEDCCSLVFKWNYLSCISLLSEIYESKLWNCSSPSNSVIILTPECFWFFFSSTAEVKESLILSLLSWLLFINQAAWDSTRSLGSIQAHRGKRLPKCISQGSLGEQNL